MVRLPTDIKSIGKSVTLAKNISKLEEAKPILMQLSDQVAMRARAKFKKGHTVQITLKYGDFKVITRQCPIAKTNVAKSIYEAGVGLLEKNWNENKSVRLIGISLTDFESREFEEQISLFDEGETTEKLRGQIKDEKVQEAMDKIRKKFGTDMVSWATLLPKDNKGKD